MLDRIFERAAGLGRQGSDPSFFFLGEDLCVDAAHGAAAGK